jgi:hypothetical protein
MLKLGAQVPKPSMVRVQIPTALVAAAAVALCAAPSALADSNTSSNWAGYAVHRSGVRFRTISASWRAPNASCRPGNQTYSASWVGLGGYSLQSAALEQIGTETDCNVSGQVLSSAWYELVPGPSQPIRLTVHPGDAMSATVAVVGHRVSVTLNNHTRHHSFSKTLNAAAIDVSSAEWIVEAPSECLGPNACQTLPLADFGSTSFGQASVRSTTGHAGTISNHSWGASKITLSPGGRRFIAYQGSGPSAGAAEPSGLSSSGSAFSVTYRKASVQSSQFNANRQAVKSGGYLVHPGR